MKLLHKSLLSSCIIALTLGFTVCGRSNDGAFHHDGNLTQTVQAIFKDLGIDIATLKHANEFAQKNLIRSGERWDKQAETELNTRIREQESTLLNHLRELYMVDEIVPKHKHYTYALLMGALKLRVAQRLGYLEDLIQTGHTFDYIVLLGGERPLRDIEKEGLPETVNTEGQMMAYLASQSPILADKKIIVVNAPMVQKPDGTLTRPTFEGTLTYFAQSAPQDGSCLAVSNNPYIVRPTKMAQRILDQSRFPTEGAGPALNIEGTGVLMVMDEFARILYEENLRFMSDTRAV